MSDNISNIFLNKGATGELDERDSVLCRKLLNMKTQADDTNR